jgi:hypothetical protein
VLQLLPQVLQLLPQVLQLLPQVLQVLHPQRDGTRQTVPHDVDW